MASVTSLLTRPVYTFGTTDRLLGIPGGTARRWIDGYERSGRTYAPVVREQRTGDEAVTWGEFVECRLLAEYRSQNVPMLRLRPAFEKLREQYATQYPLAHARPFLTAGEGELLQLLKIQDEADVARELRFVEVRTGQIRLTPQVNAFVGAAVHSKPADAPESEGDVVVRLRPTGSAGNVVLDPIRGFGEPTIRGVRTDVLAEFSRAGTDVAELAYLYDLEVADVNEALSYERQQIAVSA